MKRKIQNLFLCLTVLTALLFAACDMIMIDNRAGSGGRELSESERKELEKSGHYLKLVNLPKHTQISNVYSASVSNSSAAVGNLDKKKTVMIYRETESCTVYLPLSGNGGKDFVETGFFYTAFEIHVDALAKYIVDPKDLFVVSYIDGRGQADVNKLPSTAVNTANRPCLTVYNLPASVSVYNFSDVFVHNQTGQVAYCMDYSQIVLSSSDNRASAKIPLHYNSLNHAFTETGVFYVSFDVNVDAETRYTVVPDDKIKVVFINGNGFIDVQNIPDNPVPYLTIKGLPLNSTKRQISNVNVYNLAGSVAACSDNKNISVVNDGNFLTFFVPLVSTDGGYFSDSGRFAVSFTVNIDVETQIVYSRSDSLILPFTNGSAEFDVDSFFGYFDAKLADMEDAAWPVIKAGSSFDVNGKKCVVNSDLTVSALTPNYSCVLYLYAYCLDSLFIYEFSPVAPVYNSARRGWYNGTKRALWKMVYLFGDSKFLFKTYVNDNFPQFAAKTLTYSDYSQLAAAPSPVAKFIDGSANSAAETVTLDPGVYLVELKGAGGGHGRAYNGVSSGGSGGLVREVFTLNTATSFTAFTGSGGGDAPVVSSSGTFDIVTTDNFYTFSSVHNTQSQGHSFDIVISNLKYNSTDRVSKVCTITGSNQSMSGGGAGGGGSGSFLFSSSPDGNYLLLAGGGGGGSGGSYLTPGGAGGAGGSIGPGAGGGASGSFSQKSDVGVGNFNSPGGPGGAGGGLGGGSAGSGNGGNSLSIFSSNAFSSGGSAVASYTASLFDFTSKIPFLTYPVSASNWVPNSTNGIAPFATSSNREVSVRTQLTFSGNSGSGGNTPSVSYLDGPQAWLDTNYAGGSGSSPTPLNPVSISGDYPNISISIGSPRPGIPGSDGGNNRNSVKGGGAASGAAGSVTIHKIY